MMFGRVNFIARMEMPAQQMTDSVIIFNIKLFNLVNIMNYIDRGHEWLKGKIGSLVIFNYSPSEPKRRGIIIERLIYLTMG